MLNYGIELEFFVKNSKEEIIPAYIATSNTDGNPVIGEIKTSVFDNITDCIFDINKLLYIEKNKLTEKGNRIIDEVEIKVGDLFLQGLRKDKSYINKKELEVLEELSIYPKGKVGKMLSRGTYKASLQINISKNLKFSYDKYEKISVEDKSKYISNSVNKSYSSLFDYISIITALDNAFEKEIIAAGRVKGVYAIKSGILGDRIEYRSLPASVNPLKIIEVLKKF